MLAGREAEAPADVELEAVVLELGGGVAMVELPKRPSDRAPGMVVVPSGGVALLADAAGAEADRETTSCSFLASPSDEMVVVEGDKRASGFGG